MMIEHRWTALVSLLALLTYFWMATQVPRARLKCGIHAPAMTGDPRLERTIRVHYNTLEWLPIFLVSLWLFAVYWNELVAAALGAVWIAARIFYALSYYAAADRRGPGFMIQSLVTAVLLFGALFKIVWGLATARLRLPRATTIPDGDFPELITAPEGLPLSETCRCRRLPS